MHCPKCLTNDLTWISQLWNKSKKYNLFVNIEIVNSQINAIPNLSGGFYKAQRHVESIFICFPSSTCDWVKVMTSLLLANHKHCLENKLRSTLHVEMLYSNVCWAT